MSSAFRIHGGRLRGQLDSSGISVQARRNSLSRLQLHCSTDSPLGGVSLDGSSSTVHHGEKQCLGRLFVQTQSCPGVGMDTEVGDVARSSQEVTGDDRPVCHLVKSPLFILFFTFPRSEGSGDRCSSSELGRTSGVRFSALVPDSASSVETPLVLRSPHDSSGSVLASMVMVYRPSGSAGGRSSSASVVSRSSQTASFPLSSSRDPQAVSPCLATTQWFARAEGFSSRVASQIGFAQRASSRTNYQVKCTDNGVVQKDILFLVRLSLRLRIFCFGSARLGSCLCPLFWVTVPCFRLFFILSFQRSLRNDPT